MQTTHDEKARKAKLCIYTDIVSFEDMRGFKVMRTKGSRFQKEGKLRGTTTTFGTAFDLHILGGSLGDDFGQEAGAKSGNLGLLWWFQWLRIHFCNARTPVLSQSHMPQSN